MKIKLSVRRRHYTSKETAREIIDQVKVKELVSSHLPKRIRILSVKKFWEGEDLLSFYLKAKQRGVFIKAEVTGTIALLHDEVIVNVELPPIALTIMRPDQMEDRIGQQLEKMFPDKKGV